MGNVRVSPLSVLGRIALLGLWAVGCSGAAQHLSEGGDSAEVTTDNQPQLDGLVLHGEVTCADPSARTLLGPFEDSIGLGEPDDFDGSWYASTGLAVVDLDGDGQRDIFLPSKFRVQIFMAQGDGTYIDEWDRYPIEGTPDDPHRNLFASFSDMDADGDFDAFFGYTGGHRVFLNDGAGYLTEAEVEGLGGEGLNPRGVFWGDMDGDGDLDLAIAYDRFPGVAPPDPGHANELYERVGTWEFVDVSDRMEDAWRTGYTKLLPWFDADADGDLDLYCVNHLPDYSGNFLMENDGTGQLVGNPDAGLDMAISGMGFDVFDLNHDELPDIVMADAMGLPLMLSLPDGTFYRADLSLGIDVTVREGRQSGWSSHFADFDHDGQVDIFGGFGPSTDEGDLLDSWHDEPDGLWLQQSDGTFADVALEYGVDQTGPHRAVAVTDLNGDGWLDLVRREYKGPALVSMARCGDEAWVIIDLAGTTDNPHGYHARVTVEVDGERQTRWLLGGGPGYLSSQPPELHFGLGSAETIDRLEVLWPGGEETTHTGVPTRQRVTVEWPE